MDCHERLKHAGTSHTLATIRYDYWIPSGRSTVYHALTNCRICRRVQGGPYKRPPMPDLPKSRVTSTAPFTYVGLDYLGPLYVKEKNGTSKVWVCLFTCLAVIAIHLEVIRDMTAEQFLMCLRRFIGRRGQPKEIISDNASQFKLTDSTLRKLNTEFTTDDSICSYMSSNGITWKYITELAPWMGGFYERLVGMVKRSLRKSLGKLSLTYDQLHTLLVEIEAILNSRPLVYVASDLDSGLTLCPSNFLSLNPKTGMDEVHEMVDNNDPDYTPSKISSAKALLQNWKRGQNHLNDFWRIWRDEYLLSLRERHRREHVNPRIQSDQIPKIGDVVQLKENLIPRGSWKLGRIKKLYTSQDGRVRSAQVQTTNGKNLNRPLCLLYPLECGTENELEEDNMQLTGEEETINKEDTQSSTDDLPHPKPRRLAAERARVRIAQWINS